MLDRQLACLDQTGAVVLERAQKLEQGVRREHDVRVHDQHQILGDVPSSRLCPRAEAEVGLEEAVVNRGDCRATSPQFVATNSPVSAGSGELSP